MTRHEDGLKDCFNQMPLNRIWGFHGGIVHHHNDFIALMIEAAKDLWNVGNLPDYTALQARKQPSSDTM